MGLVMSAFLRTEKVQRREQCPDRVSKPVQPAETCTIVLVTVMITSERVISGRAVLRSESKPGPRSSVRNGRSPAWREEVVLPDLELLCPETSSRESVLPSPDEQYQIPRHCTTHAQRTNAVRPSC